jgi:elongator complex protein 3
VPLQEYHQELVQRLLDGRIRDKDDLQRAKIELCRKHCLKRVPPNSETLSLLSGAGLRAAEAILQRKPVRTLSGVAVVAVMTSPAPCPHGKCIFCPGGVDSGSPQSYTGKEPAARRGASYEFDPYEQVKGRIEQLEVIGHHAGKVDLIIMGGTFTSRLPEYQEWFVRRCFDAMNRVDSSSLEEAQLLNETAPYRCIGMTVETRPDALTEEQCAASMRLGMTRVEMGVQVLDNDILRSVNRGHGLQAIVDATAVAKRAGLKVCYHIMPGLPGSSPDRDVESFRRMFDDPSFRPDMLKIYPTLVVKGTKLHEMWESGDYSPYTTAEAVDVIARMKAIAPPYVRIQRIQRDIPVPLIEAGVDKGHLRELVKERMKELGTSCGCIRCHEVGLMGIASYDAEEARPGELAYEASGGLEHFLTFALPERGALIGYVRVRIGDGPVAIIRELKVFGRTVPLDSEGEGWQHHGFGRQLVARAEELARKEGCTGIRVTSGVGVRRYYASLGYRRDGVYMSKQL